MHRMRQTICYLCTCSKTRLFSKIIVLFNGNEIFRVHFHLWYWQRCAAAFYIFYLSSFVCGFLIRLFVSSSFCGVQCSSYSRARSFDTLFRERFLFMANGNAYKPSTNKCAYSNRIKQTMALFIARDGMHRRTKSERAHKREEEVGRDMCFCLLCPFSQILCHTDVLITFEDGRIKTQMPNELTNMEKYESIEFISNGWAQKKSNNDLNKRIDSRYLFAGWMVASLEFHMIYSLFMRKIGRECVYSNRCA